MPLNETQKRIRAAHPEWLPYWEREAREIENKRQASAAMRTLFAGGVAGSLQSFQQSEDVMPEKLVNDFVVGCDPEFVVLNANGTVRNVAAIFENDPKGIVGYDHNGLEVEIRPEPAKGTYALLRRIQRTIQTNTRLKKLTDYKWRAGAVVKNGTRNLTLGGHVHLDIPPRGFDPTDPHDERFDLRLEALDRVTKYLEALDILPRDECALRRDVGDPQNPGQRYGKWGDWREAGDGGKRRIEYRTMASWLYSPIAAYLAMTSAKLATVAPQLALDTLKARNMSYKNLKEFFELFRHKDTNARRALDKLFEQDLNKLQAYPDVDFKEKWKELPL